MHDDLRDRRMRGDLALDFRRIDVLAARLDQLLGRRAALVPEVAFGIERALIASVMPVVAEGEVIVGVAAPVTLEDCRSANRDFADLAGRDRIVGIIEYGDCRQESRLPAAPGRSRKRPIVTKPEVSDCPNTDQKRACGHRRSKRVIVSGLSRPVTMRKLESSSGRISAASSSVVRIGGNSASIVIRWR